MLTVTASYGTPTPRVRAIAFALAAVGIAASIGSAYLLYVAHRHRPAGLALQAVAGCIVVGIGFVVRDRATRIAMWFTGGIVVIAFAAQWLQLIMR